MSLTAHSRDKAVVSTPFFAVILGPTAVGKTEISIEVALRLDAEIISADSMLVYRGMDIGTGKPSIKEMRGVPHYLIDIIDPGEAFNVARYRRLAISAIEDISGRGRVPILVGGSGLYVRAVVDGIFDGPPADPGLRDRLASEARSMGAEHLHDKLALVDPVSASRIDHRNVRRVIRALEVHAATGLPLSEHQTQWTEDRVFDGALIGLGRPRAELRARIEKRIDEMFSEGLVEETGRLASSGGLDEDHTVAQAIGYSEVLRHLRGECALSDAIDEVKGRTWRYARRQMTWFRRDKRIRWVMIDKRMSVGEVVSRVVKIIKEQRNKKTINRRDLLENN